MFFIHRLYRFFVQENYCIFYVVFIFIYYVYKDNATRRKYIQIINVQNEKILTIDFLKINQVISV